MARITLTEDQKAALRALPESERNVLRDIIAQVSESSYRRGYQQSARVYGGDDASLDPFEWRFRSSLLADVIPPAKGDRTKFTGKEPCMFGKSWERVECEHPILRECGL